MKLIGAIALLALAIGFAEANFTTSAPSQPEFLDYYEEKNSAGDILFRILHGNEIQLQNSHRKSKPSIKFSLSNGVKVQSIKKFTGMLYDLNMNDKTRMRLDIRAAFSDEKTTQYWFEWYGFGTNDAAREICAHYGDPHTSWYNTYQSVDQSWPMNPAHTTPRSPFNAIMEYDHISDVSGEFYYVLEQSFYNTDGFVVSLDEYQPLFVRRDPNPGLLCFSVNNSYPYDSSITSENYNKIRMWVFTAPDIRQATDYLVHTTQVIPKPNQIPDESKFTYPSSFVSFQKEEDLLAYVNKLQAHDLKHSELIFNGYWNIRSYNFDEQKFPTPDVMVHKIQEQGYRFSLELFPEYDPEHSIATQRHFLQYSNGTAVDKDIPIRILDLTRPETADFYSGILKKLKYELDIHSFITGSLNLEHLVGENSGYPNYYVKQYLKTVSAIAENNLTSWIAYKAQHLPMFLQLSGNFHSDSSKALESIIPSVLAVSVGGYPFVSPKPIYMNGPKGANEEIHIRWLQAVALMPQISFHYSSFPWDHSEKTIELTKKFVNLHIEHAPTIIQLARNRVKTGQPIIRPLWYLAPDDQKTYRIADQFMLGEDLLVAPVVEIGQRERTVYLPPGQWVDQHGKSFSGPGEIKVAAPLEELPYFKRKFEKQ